MITGVDPRHGEGTNIDLLRALLINQSDLSVSTNVTAAELDGSLWWPSRFLTCRRRSAPRLAFSNAIDQSGWHAGVRAISPPRQDVGWVQPQWTRLRRGASSRLPPGVTLSNLLDESKPRSVVLADALKRAGIVDWAGRGIPDIFASLLRAGRAAPDYSRTTDRSVTVATQTSNSDLVDGFVKATRHVTTNPVCAPSAARSMT